MGKACEAGSARGHALAHAQQCWNLSRQAGGCSLKVYWMQGRFPGMPRQRHLPTCRLHLVWTAGVACPPRPPPPPAAQVRAHAAPVGRGRMRALLPRSQSGCAGLERRRPSTHAFGP